MGILIILMTVLASYWMIEVRDEFIKKCDKEDDE